MALLAEGILKTHWDQTVPVNLARIAKGMGLAVRLGETGDACAILEITAQRKARVIIDRTHPITRQRYGVAHALAHLALHHLRPGMRHRIRISDTYHANHSLRQDSEANDFALRLLMPEEALRYSVEQRHARTAEEVAHLFDVPEMLVKQRMADLDLYFPKTLAQQLNPTEIWD